jgi:branched-subunit amino acid ABC-type transport system permease component
MLSFFDYLYYSIFKLYSKSSDSSPEFAASCAVSGFQAFNIVTLYLFYSTIIEKKEIVYVPKTLALVIILVLIIFNYIRYIRVKKFNYVMIKDKLNTKSLSDQNYLKVFQIIYLVVSLLTCFGLVFYVAYFKNR